MLKLMEEFGELCGGIARNNPEMIKDAIGDCFVVLVILSKQLDFGFLYKLDIGSIVSKFNARVFGHISDTERTLKAASDLGVPCTEMGSNLMPGASFFREFLINLILIALSNQLDFKDCIQHAYDQIKDRKGKMVDGVFVKEEDL